MNVTFQEIVAGDPEQLDALSMLCGLPASSFPGVPVVGSGHLFRIAGEVMTRDALSRKVLRVCACCIREDVERGCDHIDVRPYGRTIWLVGSLRTCPLHQRPLIVASRDDRPSVVHDFSALIAPALPDILQAAQVEDRSVLSPLEGYLLRRLAGEKCPPTWLDEFPLYAACRVAETVGAVQIHGIRFRSDGLTEREWHKASGVGFDIASGGRPRLREFLSSLQTRFLETRSPWGPRSTFGRLYEWLAHECDDRAYDPLRSLIRDHVLETMPVGRGYDLFGAPVEVRRVHSIHSAAEKSGAHPIRLRKLAKAVGLIDGSTEGLTHDRVLADATLMEDFLDCLDETMSLGKAATYLGVPRSIGFLLFKSGLIEPWIRGAHGSLQKHAFRRSDLERFLADLLVERGDPEGKRLVGIGEAARSANCSVVEVLKLILAGRLRTVSIQEGRIGYDAIRVRVREIRPLVRGPGHGGINLRSAQIRLRVSTTCMKALIEKGHLPARRARNPVNRCPQTVVDERDIQAFAERYIPLMRLSRQSGIHHRRLKKMLDAAGIERAFEGLPTTFYERIRLPELPSVLTGLG